MVLKNNNFSIASLKTIFNLFFNIKCKLEQKRKQYNLMNSMNVEQSDRFTHCVQVSVNSEGISYINTNVSHTFRTSEYLPS